MGSRRTSGARSVKRVLCCVVWNEGNECVGGFWFRDGEVIMVRFHTPGRAGVSADAVYLYTLRLNKFAN